MSLIAHGFCLVFNHLLEQASWARERLAAFSESSVQVSAPPVELRLVIDDHGRFCEVDAAPAASRADVHIRLPFAELPTILAGGTDRLMNAARIEGNAELAETIGFVFRNLEWDAEEDLSRLVGDLPARRIHLGAQALRSAHARALEATGANLAEYLVDEAELLVCRPSLRTLSEETTEIRDRIARLEKRIARLRSPRRTGR